MSYSELLQKSAHLLDEFQLETHALPMRLRVLNMLTYTLDTLFMQEMPALLHVAPHDGAAAEAVQHIASESLRMLDAITETMLADIVPALEQRNLHMLPVAECDAAQQAWIANWFTEKVLPLLTPLAVDAGRPFPQISAHSLNLLAVIERENSFDIEAPSFARLKIPRWVPRLIDVAPLHNVTLRDAINPRATAQHALGDARAKAGAPPSTHLPAHTLILSEDMVRAHVDKIFPGMEVSGVYQFRILRGSIEDSGAPVGRHTALARQKAWPVVRIDVEQDMPEWVLRWLKRNLEAPDAVVLQRHSPLGLGSLAVEWADRVALL